MYFSICHSEIVDSFHLCILQTQLCSEAETDDRVTSSSVRLKHGLQKYAPVDDGDANSSDVSKTQERTIEVNCVG